MCRSGFRVEFSKVSALNKPNTTKRKRYYMNQPDTTVSGERWGFHNGRRGQGVRAVYSVPHARSRHVRG